MINLIVVHLGIINYIINRLFCKYFIKFFLKALDFVIILYYTIYSLIKIYGGIE